MKPVSFVSVSKWYGKVLGLNDVTLEVGEGITGLLGPNGAGKSTMLKIVTGQIRQSKGEVSIFGERIWNNPRGLEKLGFSPEGDAFYPWMSGRQFVRLAADLRGVKNPEAEVDRVLDLVNMKVEALRQIKTYSKGMRQRIKVAHALVGSPKLLVLDEPLNGTDPVGRVELIQIIEKLAKSGVSVIVSSHVLHEIERMTDNILLINHGRLLAEGNLHKIRELIDEHPHTVLIHSSEPRRLGECLIHLDIVESVQVKGDAVFAHTLKPDEFYRALPKMLASEKLHVTHLSSPDDNLEAVFEYLVK